MKSKDEWTEVDNLLYEAHLVNTEVNGLDISKENKESAKRKIVRIYNRIKAIDPHMYNVLQEERKESFIISQD